MQDSETFTIEHIIDGGGLGPIPVSVIGSAKVTPSAGPAPEYVETRILKITAHLPKDDNTGILEWECTRRIDNTERSDIHEKLESHYRRVTAHALQPPEFDFPDGGAA